MVPRLLPILAALGLLLGAALPGGAAPAPAAPTDLILMGVDETFKSDAGAAYMLPRWTRLTFAWTDVQPGGPGDFSNLGNTIPAAALQADLVRGTRIAGLIQFTPPWAQRNPADGQRSPPRNLDLPFDHPDNYWGQFVYELVRHYRGTVDEWIIWNEPEFRPGDAGAGGSFTWAGTDEEFAQLLKVAYLAAKRANPEAIVSFPGTSYWVEELATPRRVQFYQRLLAIIALDPQRVANNWYHDVVALNLYHSPDTINRVFTLFKQIQAAQGLDKSVWLTETNAMPTDDRLIPCPHSDNAPRVRMNDPGEHAAFGMQAMAMAAGTGYQRAGFYQMTDSDPCREPAVWGVYRDDGTFRPVREALKQAFAELHGFTRGQFVPLVRATQGWPVWPDDPLSYTPNWQIYQVALDRPDGTRVTVLWNGDGVEHLVRIPVRGEGLRLLDKAGAPVPMMKTADEAFWLFTLGPATARGEVNAGGVIISDPEGYYFLGGDPQIFVEGGVGDQPVVPPLLGLGGTPDFQLFVSPEEGQTTNLGNPAAQFFVRTVAIEGFAEPITPSVAQWSTQRFPEPKPPTTLPLAVSFQDAAGNPITSVLPRQTFVVSLDTSATPEGGIYFLTIQGTTPSGLTRTVDLALVLT